MEGCGMRCMKYLLFVFNFIIWIGGAGLLALAIILHFGLHSWIPVDDVATLGNNNDELLEYSAYILIGAGAIIFLMAFCGCCGALTECRYLLVIYFMVLLIIFCVQITAGILASIYSTDIEDSLDENMLDGFRMAYGNGKYADELTSAWRLAEATLECCGYHGGADYNNTGDDYSLYKSANMYPGFPDFPETCCVGASNPTYNADDPSGCMDSWDNDDTMDMDTATYHGKGCKKIVADLIDEYINWIRAGGIGLAVVELLCMLFAICVCRNVESDD
ncbi:tetraspanin-18-like [Anneissia japonica]|uniref:tetraspanin-18-like n=1 Tax=Anneissia japonica TaxID=1529436 RepID=UPI001425AED1|nr:tetraspanin-18-like [Anneissia japonica]